MFQRKFLLANVAIFPHLGNQISSALSTAKNINLRLAHPKTPHKGDTLTYTHTEGGRGRETQNVTSGMKAYHRPLRNKKECKGTYER